MLLPATTKKKTQRNGPRVRNEMRVYSFRFGCVLAAACFVSLTWIKSMPSDEGKLSVCAESLVFSLEVNFNLAF